MRLPREKEEEEEEIRVFKKFQMVTSFLFSDENDHVTTYYFNVMTQMS